MSEEKGEYVTKEEIDDALEMVGAGYEHHVKDESNDRKYFIITPRIVKAFARNPYDLALWDTIKDIAGEGGECYLSTEQLAILSGMSAGKASDSRKHWVETGFLKGEVRKDPGYPQPVWHLTVPDLWQKNIQWCEEHPKIQDRIDFMIEQKSLHHMKPSPHEGGTSPHETKKIKKVKQKEEPLGGLSEKEVEQANAKVDAMVANSGKAKYQNRDKMPEPYLLFADLYNELTGQEPTKRVFSDWMGAFEDWKTEGLQPEHIRAAWQHANRPEGGFPVGRPGALTNTAVAMKSKTFQKNGAPLSALERVKLDLMETSHG